MNDRFKFRAWIGKERALTGYGARYLYFNAIGGISDSFLKNEGFDRIEQCTGIKDKNGQLIYEGDIVELDDGIGIVNAVIEWEEKCGCWNISTSDLIYTFDNLYGTDLTVIGNIHENADLLKVGGK